MGGEADESKRSRATLIATIARCCRLETRESFRLLLAFISIPITFAVSTFNVP
ncbi:hypothetical protein IE81DRAFT_325943 [Ceraceosorus guamensis]|uniref:Uncharacterized protein n=1 Tax=Ceraceosorus guamensis TaxID=1522189 RepID=A0A316VRS5_9BASI|nr:hypothetical protein IE81DRAFT_325943 [Ceraceosorus guamensis]PWN40060.1 hypothetical protein IE81DRAFT_325943 [Ceraceosorus guamensis]